MGRHSAYERSADEHGADERSAYELSAVAPSAVRSGAATPAPARPEGGFYTGPVTDPRLFDVLETARGHLQQQSSVAAPALSAPSVPPRGAAIAVPPRPAPLPLIEPADRPEAHSAEALLAAVRRATGPMAIAPQTPPLQRQTATPQRFGPQFTGGPTVHRSRLVAASLSTAPRHYVAPHVDEPVRVPRAFRRNRNNGVQLAACALTMLGVVSAVAVMAPQSPAEHLATGPHPVTAPIMLGTLQNAAQQNAAAQQAAAHPAAPGVAKPAPQQLAQVGAPVHDMPDIGVATGTTTGATTKAGAAKTGTVTVSPPLKSQVVATSAPHASATPTPTPTPSASSAPIPTPTPSAKPTPTPTPTPTPSASAAPVNPPSTGGGSLRAAISGTSRGKTVSLGAGTFDFSNFGSGLIGVDMASSIAGISGASESTTVLQMTPHSSTKQGNVPTTHWKTNQLSLLRVSGSPTLKNFTLLATAQGHLYNGLRLNHTSNATITNVRVSGVPGNSDIPPGETFGINDFRTSGSSFTNVEVDGQNVGASGFATNGSSNVSITGSYFHDNGHGNGATFWETRNVTITDTTSTSNKDFAFNFERVSGTVKIVRPVMSGNDQGDLRFASDESSAKVTIVDPKFSGSKLRIKVNKTYLGVANKQQRSDIHVIVNGVDRTSSVVTWIS